MPQDPELQLELYRQAVDAVGGIHAHAGQLGMSPRHGGRLYSGASDLHNGILADTAGALLDHAAHCRELERRLNPLFAENLTERQQHQDMRGRARRGGA